MSELVPGIGVAVGLGILLALELRMPSFRAGAVGADRARRRRNAAFLVTAVLSALLVRTVGERLQGEVPSLLPWPTGPITNFVGCLLLAELLGWLLHYVKHRSARLWRLHVQHHRESRYDLWLVTQTHPLEVLVSGTITSAVLLVAGCTPASMELYFAFYTVAKSYQHSSHRLSLGFLDRIFIGPAYHRHHHQVGATVNFGISLTLFDVLFRTVRWPRPNETLSYGAPEEPYGFAEEMVYFLAPSEPPLPENQRLTTSSAGLPRSV